MIAVMMWRGIVSLVFLGAFSKFYGTSSEPVARILSAILPEHYDLLIHPHLKEGTFSGSVTVRFQLKSSESKFSIHQSGLAILRTELSSTQESIPIASIKKEPKKELVHLTFNTPLEPGSYNLSMTFSGSMKGKQVGLYRSSYVGKNSSEKSYLATTKFEPTFARQSFPCFDEPTLKAVFRIKVIRPKNYIALSNMNVKNEVPGPGSDEVIMEFNETPPMSTYLVAYVVSDFVSLEPVTVENPGGSPFPLRVFSPPHLVEYTAYARKVATDVFTFFIKYFDIPYSIPKMDLVAIPDFPSGAMENWAVVTFKMTGLIINEATSTMLSRQKVASVIAHELAHQWFGNLVTMKWWNDIWLNEGFARFMQFKGVIEGLNEDAMFKEELGGMPEVMMSSMAKDTPPSHAVINDANDADVIITAFDPITYGKGASILRMIECLIGAENFKKGVRLYLKSALFKNAESSDLLHHLSEASGVDLHFVKDSWLRQEGFPLLYVERTRTKAYIRQTPMTTNKGKNSKHLVWDMPIFYRTAQSDEKKLVWFHRQNMTQAVIEVGKSSPWLKLNYGFSGFYRVNYDKKTWMAIIAQLEENHEMFSPADRANLLDDSFTLAHFNFIPYAIPLEMVRTYLKKEQAFLPIQIAYKNIFAIKTRLPKQEKKIMTTFIKDIIESMYENSLGNITWDLTQKQVTRNSHVSIMTHACILKLSYCVDPVQKYFDSYIKSNTPIVGDFLALVYKTGLKNTLNENAWQIMYERMLKTLDPQEQKTMISALAGAGDSAQLNLLLEEALKGKKMKRDTFFEILPIASSKDTTGWDFFKANYRRIFSSFSSSDRRVFKIVNMVTAKFNNEKLLQEANEFLTELENQRVNFGVKKSVLDKIQRNMRHQKRVSMISDYLISWAQASKLS